MPSAAISALLFRKLLIASQLRIFVSETCRLLPESVVWLYADGRVAEAEQIIRNAAKLNKITMPDKILVRTEIEVIVESDMDGEKSDIDSRKKRGKFLNNFTRSKKTNDESARYTMLAIFRNRHLTVNIFCLSFMWSVKSSTLC